MNFLITLRREEIAASQHFGLLIYQKDDIEEDVGRSWCRIRVDGLTQYLLHGGKVPEVTTWQRWQSICAESDLDPATDAIEMEVDSVPGSSPFWKFGRDPTNKPVDFEEAIDTAASQEPASLWRRVLSPMNLPLR